MLDWEAEEGLAFVVEKLRRDALEAHRIAVQRYDIDRLVFALGGTEQRPKKPKLPDILRATSDAPQT